MMVTERPAGGTVFALDINPARTMAALWVITTEAEGPITLSCVAYEAETNWIVSRLIQLWENS